MLPFNLSIPHLSDPREIGPGRRLPMLTVINLVVKIAASKALNCVLDKAQEEMADRLR